MGAADKVYEWTSIAPGATVGVPNRSGRVQV